MVGQSSLLKSLQTTPETKTNSEVDNGMMRDNRHRLQHRIIQS